jgi:large subunit ribosomal protein L25
MEQTVLAAEKREATGSAAARRLRRDGWVPAVVYGHKEEPVSLALHVEDVRRVVAHRVKMVQLKADGKTDQVLVKDVQFDPFGEDVLHLDFERVAMDELIEVECPVEFSGTAKGAAAGGVVEHPVTDLHVRCLPADIPDVVRVSVNDLEIGDSITVGDIEPPEGVTILTEADAVLVTVRPPSAAIEEEEEEAVALEAEAVAEEPEVIGREPEETEEPAEGETEE